MTMPMNLLLFYLAATDAATLLSIEMAGCTKQYIMVEDTAGWHNKLAM